MTTRVEGSLCPRCRQRVSVQLARGETCIECQSADVWARYATGGEKLVIDRIAVAEAEKRRSDPRARLAAWLRIAQIVPSLLAPLAGALAVWAGLRLRTPRPVGPLAAILDSMGSDARRATYCGAASMFIGVVALIVLRKSRLFRAWPLLVMSLLGLVSGTSVAIVCAFVWRAAHVGLDWRHQAMPNLQSDAQLSPVARSIMLGTVVILAPDADGDARGLFIGAGAIVRADAQHAWIVTCSHVSMPYVSASSYRDPHAAHGVWVYFSDGREVPGRVSWMAPPPLDVSIVAVDLADPPPPVVLAPDSASMSATDDVCFVPNPFRDGWSLQHGRILRRELHVTSAGECDLFYSDLGVQQGDSGSGLFDGLGRLIGLNTWRMEGPAGPVGISLPADAIRAALNETGGR